jgi:hypothetical protein
MQTLKTHLEYEPVNSIREFNEKNGALSSSYSVIDRSHALKALSNTLTHCRHTPELIASALLAFNQWPHLPRRILARVSRLLVAVQARVSIVHAEIRLLGVVGLDPEFSMVRTGARKRLDVGKSWTSGQFDV